MKMNQLRWMTAAIMAALMPGGLAGVCRAADQDAAAPEFAQVPADAALVISVRFADLWNSEALRPVRDKWLKDVPADAASFKDYWGVEMADVDRITIAAGTGENQSVYFLTTSKPYEPMKLREFFAKRAKEEKVNDRTIYVAENRASYVFDDRTVATGQPDWIRSLAKRDGPAGKGPLTPALRPGAEKHLMLVAWDAAALSAMSEPPFPEFAPLMKAQLAVLSADLNGQEATAELHLTFATEAEAKAGARGVRDTRDKALFFVKLLKSMNTDTPDAEKVRASLTEIERSLNALDGMQDGAVIKAVMKMKIDPAVTAEAILKQYEQGNKEKP